MVNVLLDSMVFAHYQGGGVARYFNELIPLITRDSPDIRFLLAGDASMLGGCANIRRLKILSPMKYRPWRLFWKHIHERRVRRFQSQGDVYLATYYTPRPQPAMKSVVVVYDLIDADFPCVNPNGHEFVVNQRQVIENADRVIAISEATKSRILQHATVPEDRIDVIYPVLGSRFLVVPSPVAVQTFRKQYGLSRPYWLYVGYRSCYKNIECLLRAYSMVAHELGIDLVLAGGEKELMPHELAFVFQERLEHRVHLVGRLPDEMLSAAYAGAVGFVYPSFGEGFGIPLLEAMQCGVPVVASDIPVFREVAADAALYFDPHSALALAHSIRAVHETGIRERLTHLGTMRVKKFEGNQSVNQMAGLLRQVAGLRSRR